MENIAEKIQKRKNNQRKYYNEHSKTLDTLKEDEKKWTKAQVMEQIGTRSYKDQTEETRILGIESTRESHLKVISKP